ncbi:disintegrin and metalloproteinase domain-containing protein 12-like [Chiloscyllium punctatum]|uniref:disintegrin and metalloproteinase domain-containing protein 12-like n=1 Tax=Chiloscyllium punctatum TaxID=137246 RepID=UPI003B6362E7
MSACNVCLVFLIWCQVLNLSAAENEESAVDNGNRGNGTVFTVPRNRPTSHSPGAGWETKLKGATSRRQGTASGFRFHQQKLLEELKDYKFVFPKLLSGRGKRNIPILPQRNYPKNLSILVELEGKNFTLDLSSNKFLLPRGFQVSHYDANGTLVTETDTGMYRCYYMGSVRKFPGSQVSASMCSGFSAVIVFNNRTYVIEPIGGDADGHHLLYRAEDLLPVPSSCGVRNLTLELSLTDHLQPSQRMGRDVLSETRYVELVLVTDQNLYQNMDSNRGAVVRRMIDIANTVDLYYRPFNIRIALIGVEVWTRDQVPISKKASATMNQFLIWRQDTLLPRLHNDNGHLFIGGHFDEGVAGVAPLGAMCSKRYSGGVNSDNRPSHLVASVILAHEMGHNFQMRHDDSSRKCKCADRFAGYCIMEARLGLVMPTSFSSCSRQDLVDSIRGGLGMCLYNLPNLDQLVAGQECGNLFLEKGEDCDCGRPVECSDPCCEPSTCKFKTGAQCSAVSSVCCKDCKFVPEGTLCRPLKEECDLPEFCTGVSSNCPENVYLKDGHKCSKGGKLFCYGGVCQSADKQCQEIWGPGGKSSHQTCYNAINKRGNNFGHCGKNENDIHIKCLPENTLCGKIQCKGGSTFPIRGGQVNVVITSITVGHVTYTCRGTFSDLADASTPDLVHDGTKCGNNKVRHSQLT